MTERRIRQARFPAVKSLDTFDFAAIPGLNKMLVFELARSEYITRQENVIALGPSGTGKTHIGLALGVAACQRGHSTLFLTPRGSLALDGERWQQLFGNPAPQSLRREFLIKACAYQIQVRAFGGLSAATRRRLRAIADAARTEAPLAAT